MKKQKMDKHERMYGPHFNEECAMYAVSKMQNEDGTKGHHWSLEEAVALANQHGVNLHTEKFNKYDWFVALNMIYSDFYKVIMTLAGANRTKYFVEFAKAWLQDKDVDEGKMWYYFKYVICEEGREEYDDDDESGNYAYARGGNMARRGGRMAQYHRNRYDYDDYDDNDYEYELRGTYNMRGGNYAYGEYDHSNYMHNDYSDNYARGRRMSR